MLGWSLPCRTVPAVWVLAARGRSDADEQACDDAWEHSHRVGAHRPQGQPGETQGDSVSEFDDLEKKAQDFVEEHPEQADKGIDEVADNPEHDTDYQHDEQIDRAMDAAEQHTSQGHEQQGNQGNQNQAQGS